MSYICKICKNSNALSDMKDTNLCKQCYNKDCREKYKKKQELLLKEIEEGILKLLKCSKCKVEKDIIEFNKTFRNCKDCASTANKTYRENNKESLEERKEEIKKKDKIICPCCKVEKDRKEYSKNTISACKECSAKRNKVKYEKDKDTIKEYERKKRALNKDNKVKPDIKEKRCPKCETTKTVDEYSFSYSSGYSSHCNECRKIDAKLYREKNKEEINKRTRENYKSNPRTLNSIVCKLRSRISKYITAKRTEKAKELLGIDIKLFQEWLKYNCSIDNLIYNDKNNTWHIDHVIPCKHFNITKENIDETKACFHWTNLMPLSKEENISKQDKLIVQQTILMKERLQDFIKIKNLNYDEEMIYWNTKYNDIINIIPDKKIIKLG
jgi:hypothetical protein